MHDVCIIGFGRVGCPLGLSLEEKGLDVVALDKDDLLRENINQLKKMPFLEPGYDELLKNSKIHVYDPTCPYPFPESKAYIITVGTPLGQHIETDLSQVKVVLDMLIKRGNLAHKLIILRSTVAPGTTSFVKAYINQNTEFLVGDDVFIATCPERLAEGVAHDELTKLPQIIGAEDNKSFIFASDVFDVLGVDIFQCSYIEAELAKLFSNIYRYINFAIPNYFTYVASQFGVDIYDLFKVMNTGYPRNAGLKSPGFAAGTCLRKDFGMINEFFPQTDFILQAYKINEFTPLMLVRMVENSIPNSKIGILGYTMKRDTDDVRDSLTPKLIRYIERYMPEEIMISEPNLKSEFIDDRSNGVKFANHDPIDVVRKCDVIFIAMNHSQFDFLKNEVLQDANLKGKTVIDIWNVFGKSLINRW
jgi:UDP-N-acetyl-D-mannosaminuronic acid dehydrogenase